MYLPDRKLISELKKDLRQLKKKERGDKGGGGDFYMPFWADVKTYLGGTTGLTLQEFVDGRVDRNKRSRFRLYPLLLKGFVTWWTERRRWQNEEFKLVPQAINAQFPVPTLDAIVKVENLPCVQVGDKFKRLVYPYFAEAPELSEEAARIGLWLMAECLTKHDIGELRILDVLRSQSFSIETHPLQGNEREIFSDKYGRVLVAWRDLINRRLALPLSGNNGRIPRQGSSSTTGLARALLADDLI